jgi:hypothetical protein
MLLKTKPKSPEGYHTIFRSVKPVPSLNIRQMVNFSTEIIAVHTTDAGGSTEVAPCYSNASHKPIVPESKGLNWYSIVLKCDHSFEIASNGKPLSRRKPQKSCLEHSLLCQGSLSKVESSP